MRGHTILTIPEARKVLESGAAEGCEGLPRCCYVSSHLGDAVLAE